MSLYHSSKNRIVVVDSQNRLTGTDTDFTYDMKLPSNDFDRVVLHQFSCPRSYYDIDQYTNQFTLNEYGKSAISVSLPVGWYNILILASTLSTYLTNASSTSGNGWIYTVTWPGFNTVNTNQLTFTVTGSGSSTNPPSLTFTSEDCWVQLGFNANSTNKFVYNGTTTVLMSTNSCNISYINRLYLKSNICSEEQDQLLQIILVAGNYQTGSYIFYENIAIDANSRKYTNNSDNVFNFQLFDNYGNLILLNGLNLVFSLLFYKKDRTSELHQQHLTLKNMERFLTQDDDGDNDDDLRIED